MKEEGKSLRYRHNMHQFEIRPLQGPDLNKGLQESLRALALVNLGPELLSKIFLRMLQTKCLVYAAIQGERVVGVATLLMEQKFIHDGGIVGHIEDVAVDPTYQLNGVGSALVEFLTEQAFLQGAYKVILDCKRELIPFYERLQYREAGVLMRRDRPKEDVT